MTKADTRYGIIDGVDTWEDTITCPHCLEIDEETCEYPMSPQHVGDKAVTECSECGEKFTVTLCVEYTYQTDKGIK